MKALLLNCTLKPSPAESNTAALSAVVAAALQSGGVEVNSVRAVDRSIPPGVESDMGEGDEWPGIRAQILDAKILVFATPTWLGRPSSIAQRVLERMDAMLSETDAEERPVAYSETEEGHEWSHSTGRAAAANLLAAARALEAKPIPAPPSE